MKGILREDLVLDFRDSRKKKKKISISRKLISNLP
jgi:hypothetical protein